MVHSILEYHHQESDGEGSHRESNQSPTGSYIGPVVGHSDSGGFGSLILLLQYGGLFFNSTRGYASSRARHHYDKNHKKATELVILVTYSRKILVYII